MMTLYLASGNAAKLREFRDGARPFGIEVEMLPGIREIAPCVEDGRTFEGNARKKAAYYSQAAEGLVFADDSGLCVDALGGAPGVFSARYAGENATDDENNQKLLHELSKLQIPGSSQSSTIMTTTEVASERPNPPAHYLCVIALAEKGSVLGIFEGRADGVIQEKPRGQGGFGYDPYFYAPHLSRTFAELKAEEKFAISHRGIAFRKMADHLKGTHKIA